MKHSELAQAIHLVDYGLKSPASGYLPGYHRSTTRATAGKLAGFTSLLYRMDPKNIDMVTTRRALSPVPLVRLYESKVAITVAVLVDLSASMGFVGRARKLAEAAKLAACLSYSAYRLGDRFMLVGFGDDVELYFPPKRSPDYPWEIGAALWEYQPASQGVEGIGQACALLPKDRSLVFLVSDFHFDGAILESVLAQLRRHDGVLVVLWDGAEGEDPLRVGWTALYDPETGARTRLWLRSRLVARFRQTFQARRTGVVEACRRFGADALFVRGAFDPVEMSRFFVSRRG